MIQNERFAFLDFFKFAAAVSIAIGHFKFLLWTLPGLKPSFVGSSFFVKLFNRSELCTELFFIISGILFVLVYEQRIVKGMTFDYFLLKRMIRIYPVAIVTSIFMYMGNVLLYRYAGVMLRKGTPQIMELIYDILFMGKTLFRAKTTNNSVIWYLSVLLFCYVIAYVLTRIAYRYNAYMIFVLPIVVGVAIKYNGIETAFLNNGTSRGLTTFFIGVLLGKYFEITGGGKIGKDILPTLRITATGIFCLSCILRLSPWYNWCVSDKFAFYGVVVFPSLILILHDCDRVNRICASKVIKYLGSISFGVYLWNLPICLVAYALYTLKILCGSVVISATFVAVIVTMHIVIAGLSYRFIERPMRDRLNAVIGENRRLF